MQLIRYSRILFLLLLYFLVIPFPCHSQVPAEKVSPKIGLALAGGAALGCAHIGVLKWIEANHIPVHYIAGTSMGGLIGGCYAMGMSPDEMRNILMKIDWSDAFQSEPPFEKLPFRRKEDRRAFSTHFVLGLKHGLNLPAGINPANSIGLLLSRICLPYSPLTRFDDLPIPFRCMAVDLERGKTVVLKDGPLETALRATIAIPGAFTPVERDGKLLSDGGLMNNIPTEALKAMGTDILIAVDISSNIDERSRLTSLIDILGQTQAIAVYANERQSLKLADIIVTPDLKEMTALDFTHIEEQIQRGYDSAAAKKNILTKLSLSQPEWDAYVAKRSARMRNAILPTFVQVTGASQKMNRQLARDFSKFARKPLNATLLEDKLTSITGEGQFESFQYEQTHANSKDGLLIRANEKKYGPPFIRYGLEINGADSDNIQVDLAARLIAQDVGMPGAETRTDFRLGSSREAAFEYYRPLAGTRWFAAPRAFYLDHNISIFQGGSRTAIYGSREIGVGFDVGRRTSSNSELRFGYQFSHLIATVRTGSPALPSPSGQSSFAAMRWAYDSQDNPIIPTHGTAATIDSKWIFQTPGASGGFPSLEVRVNRFSPVGHGNSVFAMMSAGTLFGGKAAPLQQFTLGGPLRLGAYNINALRGNDYLLLGGGYLHRLAQLPPFLGDKIMIGCW